jgi:hypothetical protein
MDAMKLSKENKARRDFPNNDDSRYRDGALFPDFQPKFKLDFSGRMSVFTIGSCFARNVEEALQPFGVVLPTMGFSAPKEEGFDRSNSLLNEYNAGTMSQRIIMAMRGERAAEDTMVTANDMCSDLLLPGKALVTWERARARREEIYQVYTKLPECDVVVITLGLIEAWYDKKTDTYLNRMPPPHFARANPGRFEIRVLDMPHAMPLLHKSMIALGKAGKKVILTVSPVPLQTTFTFADCITANEFSKSVLRVCAQRLYEKFDHVDYFPSYEIVRSAGLSGFIADHVHVKGNLVRNVTSFMVSRYTGQTQGLTTPNSPDVAAA